MRCAEFLRRSNKTLDHRRSALDDDLAKHQDMCDSCRNDWQKLTSCMGLLRDKSLSPDERFTDEVIELVTESRQLRRRQQTIVWLSFAATIAAGVLGLGSVFTLQNNRTSTTNQPALSTFAQTPLQPSRADGLEDTQDMWSDWYRVAEQLPAVRKIWTETWSNAPSDSPLTASLTSGLRPVTTKMSSAIKVIGQRILPTFRTPPADDGQAAGLSPSSSLV